MAAQECPRRVSYPPLLVLTALSYGLSILTTSFCWAQPGASADPNDSKPASTNIFGQHLFELLFPSRASSFSRTFEVGPSEGDRLLRRNDPQSITSPVV